MRSDIPAELAQKLQALPPDLRPVVEAAIDAKYPSAESDAAERRERERRLRIADAEEQRELAGKVERALEGEWGDDIRRAVSEIVEVVLPQVRLLADWSRRARRREPLTRIEFAAARVAFESKPVRYALAAAKKVIAVAERERKGKL